MSLLALLVAPVAPAEAADSDHGLPAIWINAGGGTNGTDGIRVLINSAGVSTDPDAAQVGQDQIWYNNNPQYEGEASAPMLNVGGTLFYGEASAASAQTAASWTSVQLIGITGLATDTPGSPPTATAGAKGTAHFRYTATDSGRDFVVDRVVSYTYPNNFITEAYTFTIPAGNTDVVKFYLGGELVASAAPDGFGVALTSPRRTVYAVNPTTNTQIGFAQAPGTAPFDGSVVGLDSAPYAAVAAGNDIGSTVDTGIQDLGIMVQWTLGSTPGTYERSLRQIVAPDNVTLSTTFSSGLTNENTEVNLEFDLANTTAVAATGTLDFTFTLPTGLEVGTTAPSSNCAGTLTAATGGSTIQLAGGTAAAGANCVISVPVLAQTHGIYPIESSSASGLAGLSNQIGIDQLVVGTPVVTGLSPTSGPEAGGTTVTITGTGLSGATAVTFDGVAAASFTVDNGTQITAVSPAGTGTADVIVTTPGGTSPTGAAAEFTYAPVPAITGLSPTSGPEAGGTTVTITGTGFTGATGVTFGGAAAASVNVVSPTQITAVSHGGTGTVDVIVTTAGGTSPTGAAAEFTYAPVPAITGLSPTSGPEAGGTAVTITGTGLTGATAVTFGGVNAASFTVDSATQITAVSHGGTGTVDVIVTTPGGTSPTGAAAQFTYTAPAPAPAPSADQGWNAVRDQTARLYQSILGRAADSAGLAYWTQARLNGMTVEALTENLLASSERMANSGNQTNTQFINQLYQDVLGRAPDTGGLNYWVTQLDNGLERRALVLLFSDSTENVNRTGTSAPLSDQQAQVSRLYKTVFHRAPDNDGYVYWTNLLNGGTTPQRLVALMLATPEGQTVSTKSLDDFINHIYNGALGRNADAAGTTYWSSRVATNGRAAVVVWLANSVEATAS